MKFGFANGVTNVTGGSWRNNFKIVVDDRGQNPKQQPIGTVTIFGGQEDWYMFELARRRGILEYVYFGDMSPGEHHMIRNLVQAKNLQFPMARFKTFNSNKTMWNRDKNGTKFRVENEDVGATNVFLYLGDDVRLGERITTKRAGLDRGKKVDERRVEDFMEANFEQCLY